MRQLDPMDAVFLSMETASTPGHIGGLAILNPSTSPAPFDFERFQGFVRDRIALCPRFSWKLQEVPFGLDLPYWVEAEGFRAQDHIRRVAVPSPGGQTELAELAGMLFERPLDRARPMWEMFFVEGLQGGRAALLWKMHHCMMDGESGAGLVELLFDLAPEPSDCPLLPIAEETSPGQPGGLFEMAQRAVANAVKRPVELGRHLANGLARMSPEEFSPVFPRVAWNGVVGASRGVAWTSVSLEEVKAVKDHYGVTVNDVVLAMTSGAVRRYLETHEELPAESLRVIIPMSTRTASDGPLGNSVTQVSMPWATNIADPIERLHRIHDESQAAKQSGRSGVNLIEAMGDIVAPAVLQLITWYAAIAPESAPLPGNAVVSNVRATSTPLYLGGARIEEMAPISLLGPGQGLNITVVSYRDSLFFGITVDPELVREPWYLADGIPKALAELEGAG